jgi:hypothetical protein
MKAVDALLGPYIANGSMLPRRAHKLATTYRDDKRFGGASSARSMPSCSNAS